MEKLDQIEKESEETKEAADEVSHYYSDHSAEYRWERHLKRPSSETFSEPSGMEDLGTEEKLHMRSEFPPDY